MSDQGSEPPRQPPSEMPSQVVILGSNYPDLILQPVSTTAADVVLTTVTSSEWLGPIPPPEALREFAAINPTFPERILRLTESEAEHRRSLEQTETNARIADISEARGERRRGQWFAFMLATGFLGGAIWVTLAGHPWVGGTLGGATIGSIVTAFVVERHPRQQKSASQN